MLMIGKVRMNMYSFLETQLFFNSKSKETWLMIPSHSIVPHRLEVEA